MDEGLGFFTFGDIVDGSGNIYSGPLTFDHVHCIPGFDIESTTGVTSINCPNLLSIDASNSQGGYLAITGNSGLVSVSMPLFLGPSPTSGIQIKNNSSLTTINLPSILYTIHGQDFRGNALTAASVNAILARCVASPGLTGGGTVDLSGGTNAAPTGQGIVDAATLTGRGVSVTTN